MPGGEPSERAHASLSLGLIFVVGARRSGTYWLQRILISHPEVSGVPSETYLFSRGVAPLLERLHQGVLSSPQVGAVFADRSTAVGHLRTLCDSVLGPFLEPGARYLAERTPEHVSCIEQIGEVYPSARFVHIIRDGRDVARSLVAAEWGPKSIEEAAAEWRDSVQAGRANAPPPERYREIHYGELLTRPEPTIRSLFGWLGVSTDEEVIEQALAEARTRLNLNRADPEVGLDKWRQSLRSEDLDIFEQVAGELRRELGHAPAEALHATASNAAGPIRALRRRGGDGIARGLSAARGRLARAGAAHSREPAPSESQSAVDRLLAAMRAGDPELIAELLTADAAITIVSSQGRTVRRGEPGRKALVDAVQADPAFRCAQRLGDLHPSLPTTGVVLSFGLEDGSHADRVLFVSLRGGLCHRLALYQLPLAPAAPPPSRVGSLDQSPGHRRETSG